MYLVSILIPVYGVEKYIERCARSLFEQTYDNLEYIFVDDCSPDNSIAILKKVLEDYPERKAQVRIIRHERNKGLSAARNTATDAAMGDYIFYLDSDDEITRDCIEILIKPVQNNETIEIVAGNYENYYENPPHPPILRSRSHLSEGGVFTNKDVRDNFFSKTSGIEGHAWNKLIKKTFLQQYNLKFKDNVLWEDILWSFFLVKYLNCLYVVSDITLYYYVHPKSILRGTSNTERSHHLEKVYEEIANNFTKREEGREAKYYLRGFCSCSYIYNPKSQSSFHAATQFKKALSDSPHIFERMYLFITMFLSKSFLGRKLYIFVNNVRNSFRK